MRLLKAFILAILLVMVAMVVVNATGSGVPAADTYFGNGNNNDTKELEVVGSCFGDCADVTVAYLRWDFTVPGREIDPSATVNFARLTLVTTSNVVLAGQTVSLQLLEVLNDSWNETDTTAPGYGTAILTLNSISLTDNTAGQQVVFEGPALASYIENQRFNKGGNDKASVAIRVSSSNAFGPTVTFWDKEGTGVSPTLLITASNATAVTLSTFHAVDPAVNWPLIVGLGALAAAVVGGVAVSRRRAARG